MIKPGEAGLSVSVGISGAGKTHGVKDSVMAAVPHHPVIVIDRMKEWNEIPPNRVEIGHLTVGISSGLFKDALPHISAGKRLIILRPNTGQIEKAVEDACQWARDVKYLAGIAIPEAHNVAPTHGRLRDGLGDVVSTWRHCRVRAWFDTQRIALLNRQITENAREVRIYATTGDRDLTTVRSLGGRELEAAVIQCTRRLSEGEAGWHVNLGLVRVSPFIPVRE
jgi:hypothetical protein